MASVRRRCAGLAVLVKPDGDALAAWIQRHDPTVLAVHVHELAPIDSVGNARIPWSFRARIEREEATETLRCVMLVKAAAGQLETSMDTEFATLRAVEGSGVPMARPLWIDADGEAFDHPFFVTEWQPGVADMALLRAPLGDSIATATALQLADVAAALHAIDIATRDVSHLGAVTAQSAATAQLDYWEPIAERNQLEPLPALRYAFGWLRRHAPVASRVSIIHGDLRVGNFLALEGRITALLDWEMCHLGDPLEDLAWTYRTLWSPERHLSLDAFLARYTQQSGMAIDPNRFRWYRMFNEVKHSVISLTAAHSFATKASTNVRFADRNLTVAPFLDRFFDWKREGDHQVSA